MQKSVQAKSTNRPHNTTHAAHLTFDLWDMSDYTAEFNSPIKRKEAGKRTALKLNCA